jgi:hypothetical protein
LATSWCLDSRINGRNFFHIQGLSLFASTLPNFRRSVRVVWWPISLSINPDIQSHYIYLTCRTVSLLLIFVSLWIILISLTYMYSKFAIKPFQCDNCSPFLIQQQWRFRNWHGNSLQGAMLICTRCPKDQSRQVTMFQRADGEGNGICDLFSICRIQFHEVNWHNIARDSSTIQSYCLHFVQFSQVYHPTPFNILWRQSMTSNHICLRKPKMIWCGWRDSQSTIA